MSVGMRHIRRILALVAAVVLATASFAAPSTELAEDLHHAALHAAGGVDQVASAMGDDSAPTIGIPGHPHPDTPAHSHCAAACHIQIPDARFAIMVAYAALKPPFAALPESFVPSTHLDGLFRPPRA